MFVKCAHVPEGKAEEQQLRMSWPTVPLAGDRQSLLSCVFHLVQERPGALGDDP